MSQDPEKSSAEAPRGEPTAPFRHPDTAAVHGGGFAELSTRDLVPPLHMSTVFRFDGVEEMAATFRGEREAWIYTRYGNPTLEGVERHVAALEGAEAGLALSSGMAAISTALLAVLSRGEHVIAAADIYGGTRNLLTILERFGIAVDYLPIERPGDFPAAVRPETRVLYLETPTNPTLKVVDLAASSRAARERGLKVIVDNTFATPVGQRPLALGADLVVHSATKALAGHDDVTAGFIVGSRPLIDRCREVMKWVGGCLDPHAAWLIERGLKTLALRVARQSENAMALATWLSGRKEVRKVLYPGLPDHPAHAIARSQMSCFGGLFAFELTGGAEAAAEFVRRSRLIRLAPTLGGVETICLIPAVSSHIRLSPEERNAIGIPDGLIRVSCGIEHPEDLIDDIERGIRA